MFRTCLRYLASSITSVAFDYSTFLANSGRFFAPLNFWVWKAKFKVRFESSTKSLSVMQNVVNLHRGRQSSNQQYLGDSRIWLQRKFENACQFWVSVRNSFLLFACLYSDQLWTGVRKRLVRSRGFSQHLNYPAEGRQWAIYRAVLPLHPLLFPGWVKRPSLV